MVSRRSLAWTLLMSAALAMTGCGGDGIDRVEVTGAVTLDDRPLDGGHITFEPIGKGTSAGATIADGSFTIPKDKGPSPGQYRVRISAYRGTGEQIPDPDRPGQTTEKKESIIPDRYNRNTELERTVTADGENDFPFKLTSP